MKKVSRVELESILQRNVCDIRFIRRHPTNDRPPTRRMIATKSYNLLNSTNGRIKLNYRPPRFLSTADPVRQNLVIVWDLLMQDYRNVSMEECYILKEVPVDDFWDYFNKTLYPMSPGDKMALMNS